MKPQFATNRPGVPGERVANALRALLTHLLELWKEPFELAISTAYFNPEGYDLIADELEQVGSVRLLLGAEPRGSERTIRHLSPDDLPERAEPARLWAALTGHYRSMLQDRDLLGFELAADCRAQRLVGWLRSGSAEVRRLETRFLHGKAFLISTHDEGVIAGSSNLTYAGLAVNAELNLGHYDPHVVRQVKDWFEEQWADAEPFDLAAIYEARYLPHNPYLIYLRMLYERYGAELEREAEEQGLVGIHLTSFQQDGVWRAKRILRRYDGVLVADGVGLGKSFIGGELIREAVRDRRQRVLLVAPAALRDGPWRQFLLEHQLGIEVVSFEELSQDRQLNPDSPRTTLAFDRNDYAMIVVDEAHAFRSPDTLRAGVLRRLLSGSPPKELVFLTATPVNNSLWDLYYLVSYFVRNDATFSDMGIKSLKEHFAGAVAEAPDELSPERLFDVLDAVAVRRTRHFVKRYYPHDTITVDGLQIPITFPQPHVRKVSYDLEDVLPGFFPRFAHALLYEAEEPGEGAAAAAQAPQLTLARYVPSRYLKEGVPETHELQLAGLLRSGLLKRFESSVHAFAQTCRRMADSHDAFLELLDRGFVATGEPLAEWMATDTDQLDALFEPPAGAAPASDYHVNALRAAVESDRSLLLAFAEEAERISRDKDPKLRALVTQLEKIAAEASEEAIGEEDERDKRKVIVFTYFADTVEWIHDHLRSECARRRKLAAYRDRMAAITGDEGHRAEVLFGFTPKSCKAPPGADWDRYDLLISTDVLAEGMNLQQARHIINFDLPWNPMRLVQRHGRIDRIGSRHDRVFIRCFFPDRQLDDLLGLEERLHRKIAQAAASVGIESEVIPGSRISEITFAEMREEIERLRRENAEVFETAGERGTAFSGEEYRQELREGLEHHDLAQQVKDLPWGSGSGMASDDEGGFVFCIRVADHKNVMFRYVSYADPTRPEITADTLTCLARAHALPDTPRVLTGAIHRLAYDAWALAREDVFERWQFATDPRNLQPQIPKAMRDAADLLRRNPPPGLSQDERHRVLDALEAPYGVRIQKIIRDAIRSSEDPQEQAEAVVRAVRELGLQPSPPPEPLPVISREDVHLVCWMAIAPAGEREEAGSDWAAPEQISFVPEEQTRLSGRS
ncbi:MAG: helicase [Gemmatimonadetes bacterium]|nr:helicase [Gemmatimonadota bacterium]